jgi:hypothetical protein
LLGEAKDVPSEKKLQMVGELYAKFGSVPPPLATSSSNTVTTHGDISPAIIGNGNNVNVGTKNE